MRNRNLTVSIAALLTSALYAGPSAAECVFAKLGEMAVDVAHGAPRVEIEANGQKRWVLLVTGSHTSAMTKSAAAALGSTAMGQANMVRMTPKGEERLDYTILHDVVIGGAFRIEDFEVLIDDRSGEAPDDVAGYLGADILAASDVEFDLAHSRVSFFKPKGCDKNNLGYWGGSISEAAMVNVAATRQSIRLANIAFRPRVTLNGKPVTAELNSSYRYSVVDLTTAGGMGLKPGGSDVRAAFLPSGASTWVARFTEFAIGEEKIRNPSFLLRDLYRGAEINQTGSKLRTRLDGLPEMILGQDFMQSHRILVANSQQKIYFSYNGGPVFKTPPSQP